MEKAEKGEISGEEEESATSARQKQTFGVEKADQRTSLPARRRGRPRAESSSRQRANSLNDVRDIRELMLQGKKRDRDSTDKNEQPQKKSAVDEQKYMQGNMSNNKEEEEYKDMSDRELMLTILRKMNKMEREREKDKEQIKAELKQEIKKGIGTERKALKVQKEDLEERINKKIEAMKNRLEELEQNKIGSAEQSAHVRKTGESRTEVEKKLWNIERKCERMEAEERKKCIIVKGLKAERKELEKRIEKFFQEKLQVSVKVQKANLIGAESKIIRIKLSAEDKEKVMSKKSTLRNEERKIYIDHDRSKSEREAQKKVVSIAKAAKEEGREVKIMFKKIQVDEKWYKWNEKTKLCTKIDEILHKKKGAENRKIQEEKWEEKRQNGEQEKRKERKKQEKQKHQNTVLECSRAAE